jgi:hypothetical protein
MHQDQLELLDLAHWGARSPPVMPTILGGLHEIRTIGTVSFGVLVSSLSPSLVGCAVGRCSFRSKTSSGTGAHVEAFVDSSSMIALLA